MRPKNAAGDHMAAGIRRAGIAALIALATACTKGEHATAADAGATMAPSASAPATAAKFVWVAAPTLAQIPTGPVRGEANGRPFDVKTIVFEPHGASWHMWLAAMTLQSPTDTINEAPSIVINLPDAPVTGKKWTSPRGMGSFH